MTMDSFDLVIVGNGLAANRLLSELAEHTAKPSSIAVIGEETVVAYNRILLSPLLAGDISIKQIELDIPECIEKITTQITNTVIVKIDSNKKQLLSSEGKVISYSKLVIATGATPNIPKIDNSNAVGVMSFRTLADVERMQAVASTGKTALVVGGGFLGLEAAEGLRKQGMNVTLIHRSEYILNRQLDQVASSMLKEELTERGLSILTNSELSTISTQFNKVSGVTLTNGSKLDVDLIVFATGITPRIELAKTCSLETNRGIIVNTQLETSITDIYALGECIEFEGNTYGLVAPIWEQCTILAANLCGSEGHYNEKPVATQLKISGIDLYSFGEIDKSSNFITYLDEDLKHYRKLWFKDKALVGAVLYGDTSISDTIAPVINNPEHLIKPNTCSLFATG
jgi:nitrite reductase (NADH) large subunit